MKVVSVFKRSAEAEGNPFHKSFTRIPFNEKEVCVEKQGLEGSHDWCRDKQVRERESVVDPDSRAILVQTEENVCHLAENFPELESLRERERALFGQNVTLKGCCSPDDICVGDLIEVRRNGGEVCRLKVSSPRWPCYKIDLNHRIPSNELRKEGKGVRGYCLSRGYAGFFCHVDKEGSIKAGDDFVIVQRTHPAWTLRRVSHVFYGGERNRKSCMLDEFNGTEEELKELLEMKELAVFEWRGRLMQYVAKREALSREQMQRKRQFDRWVITGAWVMALVAIVAILLR